MHIALDKLQSRPQEYLDTDRTIKLLLKNNAKTDIKDSNVKTQTQIAQECGYGDINAFAIDHQSIKSLKKMSTFFCCAGLACAVGVCIFTLDKNFDLTKNPLQLALFTACVGFMIGATGFYIRTTFKEKQADEKLQPALTKIGTRVVGYIETNPHSSKVEV